MRVSPGWARVGDEPHGPGIIIIQVPRLIRFAWPVETPRMMILILIYYPSSS